MFRYGATQRLRWFLSQSFSGRGLALEPTLSGGNSKCDGKARVRRDWDLISTAERSLYTDAVEESIQRGYYQAFLPYHADFMSSIQSHETCSFALWHRRYLLAFENMLRTLDEKYACLTVPYWNVMEHFRDQERLLCSSYGSCSRIVGDLGGTPIARGMARIYSGIEADGDLFVGPPIQSLRDDRNQPGIPRADLLDVPLPEAVSYAAVISSFRQAQNYVEFAQLIQTGVHDYLHDTIGGFMPTYSSPIDPMFGPWHSFIDLLLFVWEICNVQSIDGPVVNGTEVHWAFNTSNCKRTSRARELFPEPINQTSEMYMKALDKDIRDDAQIGRFFSDIGLQFQTVASVRDLGDYEFTYDHITAPLQQLMSDQSVCRLVEQHSWTAFPTPVPATRSPVAQTERSILISTIREALESRFPNRKHEVNHQMSYLICVLDDPSFVPPVDFVAQFLAGEIVVPSCTFLLAGGGGVSPTQSPSTLPLETSAATQLAQVAS